ncbi:MAG: D-alanyl-D-alanine carboxypeptidase family protein [Actinomycetales bacterium]|nr:D-alanyl-D-alanine carboxypeptidase family protein [Actinomycetales bacterium]
MPGLVAPAVRAVMPRPAALLVAACALVSGSVVQVTVHQIAEDNAYRAAVAAEAAAERAAQERQIRVDGAAASRLSGQATAYLAHRRTQAREVAQGAVQTADALASVPPDVVAPEDLAELSVAMTELNSLLAQTPDADVALSRAAQEVARTAPADEPASEPVAEADPAEVLSITPLADAVELLEGATQAAEGAASSVADTVPSADRSAPAASRSTSSTQPSDTSATAPSTTPLAGRTEPVAATLDTAAADAPADLAAAGTPEAAEPYPARTTEAIDPTALLTPDVVTTASADVLDEGLPAVSLLAVADLDLGDSERLEAAAERVLELSVRVQAVVDEVLAQRQAEEEARAEAAAAAKAKAGRLENLVAAADAAPNGAIPSKYLCSVAFDRRVQLRCDAAAALEQLNRAYVAASGHNLRVSSSYRTAEQQAVLHEEKGDLAATAGTSNHGRGQAIDLAGAGDLGQFNAPLYLWLAAHAGDYGWHHPSYMDPGGAGPLEPWHWEYGTED